MRGFPLQDSGPGMSELFHDLQVEQEERRFINCEACQTEGRILTNDGGPDDVDHGVCPECNGECVVEVQTEPVTPDDWECEDCIGMKDHGCYCKAVGAVGPGGPLRTEE